jgi:hypothetical protein
MKKAKVKIRKNTWVSWSEDEIKLLKRLFPSGGAREIAKHIGRPLIAVRQKAYNMGIKTRGNRLWSASEIRHLKRLYPSETIQSIADKLGRSFRSVVAKAFKLGLTEKLRVWSKRELNLLTRLYPSRTAQEIADQIGRSVHATRLRIVKLGLRKRLRYEECHRVVNGTKQKPCRCCKQWKKESLFYRNRSSIDGLQLHCKECQRKRFERKRKGGKR